MQPSWSAAHVSSQLSSLTCRAAVFTRSQWRAAASSTGAAPTPTSEDEVAMQHQQGPSNSMLIGRSSPPASGLKPPLGAFNTAADCAKPNPFSSISLGAAVAAGEGNTESAVQGGLAKVQAEYVADANAKMIPPWARTAYDHDHHDKPGDPEEYPEDCPNELILEWSFSEAETDSGGSHSEGYEEFVTDSDSDALYSAQRRRDIITPPGYMAEIITDEQMALDSSSDVDDSDMDDADPQFHNWPATDTERYNHEAASAQQQYAKLATSDSSDPPTSDPDTPGSEDEKAQQSEACLPASFASKCTTTANTTAKAEASSSDPPAAAAAARVAAADAQAIREIRHYQATVHNLVSEHAFRSLAEEVLHSQRAYFVFSNRALKALQAAAEDHLIRAFQDASVVALAADRQKVCAEDIGTSREIKQERQQVTMERVVEEQVSFWV